MKVALIGVVAIAGLAVVLSAVPVSAVSTVPTKINFQGRLTTAAGAPVADGLYNMKIAIYDAASGGTLKWSETRETTNRVQVTGGLFSTKLGDVTAMDPTILANGVTTPLYFEITLANPATATNINQALNKTSGNLTLQTTTSGNIVLNAAGGQTCNLNTTWSCTSDIRLKNVQGNVTDNLTRIMQLQPVYFAWKADSKQSTRIGLIAQNVQTEYPELVQQNADGTLSLDYQGLIAPVIGAVQEQQAQIDALKMTVTSIQSSSLTNGGTINGNVTINGNFTAHGAITLDGTVSTGDIYIGGHLASKGAAPTTVIGSELGVGQGGVGAPTISVDGTDTAGTISITAGTQGLLSGVLAHVTSTKTT